MSERGYKEGSIQETYAQSLIIATGFIRYTYDRVPETENIPPERAVNREGITKG